MAVLFAILQSLGEIPFRFLGLVEDKPTDNSCKLYVPLPSILVETAEQQIVRQLTEKRIIELNESLTQTKEEYQ